MNKKGLFFTVISIVLVSIILIAFVTTTQNRTQDIIDITSLRVETADSFVKFLERTQFERAVKTSINYALSSFSSYIDDNKNNPATSNRGYLPENNVYYSLFKAVLGVECNNDYDFLSFNLKQNIIDESNKYGICSSSSLYRDNVYLQYMKPEGLSDQTIPGILNDINLLAKDTGLNFKYVINSLDFELKDAWTIQVSLDLSYTINDSENTLNFNQDNLIVTVDVPITGQKDPLYIKNGYDKFIHNQDEQSEVLPWRFVENNQAPSYFKRLVGDFSSDGKGIQSVINPSSYASDRTSLGTKSYVDYEYFNVNVDRREIKCRKVNGNSFVNLGQQAFTFYKNKGVDIQESCGQDFIDCSNQESGWKNSEPLNCGISCTNPSKPLLQYRYCGSSSNPSIETRCVADQDGSPKNACSDNCVCGDNIVNKACGEQCEPGPGVNCNPTNCKFL